IPENASVYDTLLISGDVSMDGNFYYNLLDYGSAYGCIENEGEAIFSNIVHRFPDDAVISSPNDIESICMEMEHSYLGDLELWITCPSGNRMDIFNGYRNSYCANQFLGEPNDYDEMCMSGEPYQYCWTHDASLTMEAQASNSPSHSYVDNAGHAYSNLQYIPEGNYLPTGDWTNLVGCPMNGVWTLNVNDQLDFDEGFVFSFSVQFEADSILESDSIEVSTDSVMYTQVFSEEDFSWNGQGIISGQNGSSTMVVSSEEPGMQTYTFSVVNNYGCTYDTTFSIFFCNPDFTETYITECDSAVFYGIVYHESGDYMVNAACGNEEMLHLSILHTIDTTITISNCDEYVWNDEIFTESGTYTRHLQGFTGCDSTVTLNLTIKNSVEYEFRDTSCGPYEWDGRMYTETAPHQRIYPAANGCDSIVTLHLVVYESETIDTIMEVPCCQYEMNGYTYTEAGNYLQVLTTINGCDSIIQFSLIFTDSISSVDDYKPTGTMLSPNPANNEINIVSEDLISKVEIITPIGHVVLTEVVGAKSVYLDISDLSAGVYFAVVWFKDNRNPVLLKFVKQ
ncbi:MAG: T9SS type A sorting domain-containing protein, partial [Bacteroidales bacterium]|nr:T9SS type A sorting domain-containing protein [Bacteroidales bacterium]